MVKRYESNDRKDAGDTQGARDILMKLCQSDLRCLDASTLTLIWATWFLTKGQRTRFATTRSDFESANCH